MHKNYILIVPNFKEFQFEFLQALGADLNLIVVNKRSCLSGDGMMGSVFVNLVFSDEKFVLFSFIAVLDLQWLIQLMSPGSAMRISGTF